MFENASVMVLLQDNEGLEVCKIETDRKAQAAICKSYAQATGLMLDGTEHISFDGNYSPDADEILCIDQFALDEIIWDAVQTPAGIDSFVPDETNKDKIKAIFVGEICDGKMVIAFQKFKKEQYISVKGINLFFDKETFVQEKRFGITISDEVDCVYEDGKLLFKSFFMARQIFSLMQYYREATQGEVERFTQMNELALDSAEIFIGQADSRVRKKIASIMDSGVLEKFSARDIQKIGRQTGVNVTVRDKRIVIPADKKQMKIILGFLDEEVYKGAFSNATYITNSKRSVG
ncbi:MAG: DUF4868 domain-containing protein [Acetatifactor sp.]|nr:DUF4868 domain-containing protein [Acetatifactor sp.]